MKKLILLAVIPLLLMNCISTHLFSPNSHNHITAINTTTGQELLDLQQALDSGAINQEEYDELKLKIIERLDAPADSTVYEVIKMIMGSGSAPEDSTITNPLCFAMI